MTETEMKKKYSWVLEDTAACACDVCKELCQRPCWPLPEEADKLIELGYARQMMLDYWVGDGEYGGDINIISPALIGYGGLCAPFWPGGTCGMQDLSSGLCNLHDVCKPYEGRVAHHARVNDQHEAVAGAWNCDYGREVVERWSEAVGMEVTDE